ncbi:MAG: hypothetical protein IPM56_03755 [Ignavibacteriales bacterium]|nr:MAG: hypothetical protein IPM56_03755 [Ignavibacteriales bacterium]
MKKIIFILVISIIPSSLFSRDYQIFIYEQDSSEVSVDTTFNLYNFTPLEFIEILKEFSVPTFTLWKEYKDWVKEEDIPVLIKLLDNKESCANVKNAFSSFADMNYSTVAQEAAYMILSFQKGKYPSGLNSSKYVWNKKDIIDWWSKFKKQ